MDDEKEKQSQLDLLMERIKEDGVATVQTKDGRMFFFSVKILEDLLEAARSKNVGHCSFLIKSSESLN